MKKLMLFVALSAFGIGVFAQNPVAPVKVDTKEKSAVQPAKDYKAIASANATASNQKAVQRNRHAAKAHATKAAVKPKAPLKNKAVKAEPAIK